MAKWDKSQLPVPSLEPAEQPSRSAGWQDLLTTLGYNLTFDSMMLEMPPRRNRGGGRGFPSANYHAVISQSGSPCQGIRQSIVPYSINLYNKCLILQAPCRKINPNPSPLFCFVLFFFCFLMSGISPCSPQPQQLCFEVAQGRCTVGWWGQGWGQGWCPSNVPSEQDSSPGSTRALAAGSSVGSTS